MSLLQISPRKYYLLKAMKHYDEYSFAAAIGKPYTTKELVETIKRTLGL